MTVECSAELSEMFELIEAMGVPAGYRVEIIEGAIVLNQHRKVHAVIIRELTRALGDTSSGIVIDTASWPRD
ncbi:hypothetical protein [Streptomyces sp. I05A-00742]|uniref:hypothetical protein n=1 Tax=Streptomyces sp. I05A-00742 TaxID=2732853 RepID=UPI001BB21678|nr:hypothetical protein [Streptomyces sp. I05A-00742]